MLLSRPKHHQCKWRWLESGIIISWMVWFRSEAQNNLFIYFTDLTTFKRLFFEFSEFSNRILPIIIVRGGKMSRKIDKSNFSCQRGEGTMKSLIHFVSSRFCKFIYFIFSRCEHYLILRLKLSFSVSTIANQQPRSRSDKRHNEVFEKMLCKFAVLLCKWSFKKPWSHFNKAKRLGAN